MTYAELKSAAELLGLGDRASLAQIKSRHRALVKEHHPDRRDGDDDPERIRRINAAYAILSDYCRGYRFSFTEEEFFEQQPEERLRRQFGSDPVWGGG